jgi:hypothetical protein
MTHHEVGVHDGSRQSDVGVRMDALVALRQHERVREHWPDICPPAMARTASPRSQPTHTSFVTLSRRRRQTAVLCAASLDHARQAGRQWGAGI